MRNLLTIILTERRSLSKGFLVVFLLVLPFTFLPTIIRHGLSMQVINQRIPESLLYAALFAAGVIMIALLNNYEKLLLKKRLYNFPAFTELDFRGAVEGYNSIIKELSTYLIGKVGNYIFRVDIINPAQKNVKIEIAPLIYIGQNHALLERLLRELHLKENLYLSRVLSLSEEQLFEKDIVRNELIKLSTELSNLGVMPLEADQQGTDILTHGPARK